jgi:hypothetical protein
MRLQSIIKKEIKNKYSLDTFYDLFSDIIRNTNDVERRVLFQGVLTYYKLLHNIPDVDCEFDAIHLLHKRIQYRSHLYDMRKNTIYNRLFIEYLISIEDVVDKYVRNYRRLSI